MVGDPESKRLKVAALNLFHPTTSPPLQKVSFFIFMTQPLRREDGVRESNLEFLRGKSHHLVNRLGI